MSLTGRGVLKPRSFQRLTPEDCTDIERPPRINARDREIMRSRALFALSHRARRGLCHRPRSCGENNCCMRKDGSRLKFN